MNTPAAIGDHGPNCTRSTPSIILNCQGSDHVFCVNCGRGIRVDVLDTDDATPADPR